MRLHLFVSGRRISARRILEQHAARIDRAGEACATLVGAASLQRTLNPDDIASALVYLCPGWSLLPSGTLHELADLHRHHGLSVADHHGHEVDWLSKMALPRRDDGVPQEHTPAVVPPSPITLHVGDEVECRAGRGVLRSVQEYDGGHRIGVDIQLINDEGKTRGFISGCPTLLNVCRPSRMVVTRETPTPEPQGNTAWQHS